MTKNAIILIVKTLYGGIGLMLKNKAIYIKNNTNPIRKRMCELGSESVPCNSMSTWRIALV